MGDLVVLAGGRRQRPAAIGRAAGLGPQKEFRRYLDCGVLANVFVERLWRSVKYEDVYLKGYETGKALREGLKAYFLEFNGVRLHQSLGDKTPDEKYYENQLEKKAA